MSQNLLKVQVYWGGLHVLSADTGVYDNRKVTLTRYKWETTFASDDTKHNGAKNAVMTVKANVPPAIGTRAAAPVIGAARPPTFPMRMKFTTADFDRTTSAVVLTAA